MARALPSGHLGRVGLDLMLAVLAPHDQPNAGGALLSVIGGPDGFSSVPRECRRSLLGR